MSFLFFADSGYLDVGNDADNEGSNIEPAATHSTDLEQDFDTSFDAFDTFTEADWSNIDQATNNGLGSKL
jgi:hypothetical protein